jgi:hypothetical protein
MGIMVTPCDQAIEFLSRSDVKGVYSYHKKEGLKRSSGYEIVLVIDQDYYGLSRVTN